MPLVTQSDLGSENFGVAKAQTALRHYHDPQLEDTIQHRWMRSKKNVKPEIAWSQLRRRFTPGYEDQLEEGVTMGWYNRDDPIHRYVFWWIFVLYLQTQLDDWKKRKDKNKILPNGPPNLIFQYPDEFNAKQFHASTRVAVRPEGLQAVRAIYAPSSHDIFHLVPPDFDRVMQQLYTNIGKPAVEFTTAWHALPVPIDMMLNGIWSLIHAPPAWDARWDAEPDGSELREGFLLDDDEPEGLRYMGGLSRGAGLPEMYEDDTDKSSSASEEPQNWVDDVGNRIPKKDLPQRLAEMMGGGRGHMH
ncbi:hypothetical protein CALVIDRAFT_527080 [Calocera viscosa TUFC12733]|uniref:Uncharacterized protein n=1 Tax=Calocera viscosa (strain TUFC12733) TaxID=1330018 RepID=A0A167MZA0_CALVF|nr:hypothetical protein CALVIDRAFT_527080 [Calocera viscosa TUFC12733]